METQVTSWLNEGLRHYSSGDAARALEAWYRILEVEPTHPAALEYVAFVRDTFRADGTPVAVAPAEVAVEAAPVDVVAPVAFHAEAVPAAVMPLHARRVDSVDGFSWADLVGDAVPAPQQAPAPVDVAVVEVAPVEVAVVEVAVAEVAVAEVAPVDVSFDDDGGVDVEMADDEPAGLPSMIVEQDDDDVVDEEPAAVSPSMIIEADSIELDAVDAPTVLVAPASLLSSSGEDEVMPAPDAVSASRNVPRRLTPLSTPAPPLTIDFDALVRGMPPAPAIEIASVVLDPPVFDIPRAPTPMAMTTSIASPSIASSAPLEDRVMRQSIRFDEPRAPARGASAAEGSGPVVIAPPTPVPALSPWDDAVGPAELLDLDVSSRPVSSFDSLLRAATSEAPVAAAVVDEEPSAWVGEAAPHVDELESLMTGARELFDLGDFTGSLELVEKVLRSNDKHEGALAYLKRNESTLLRMYESKIGDMTRVPRPLVPPDEVIWMNMHHRAGFILSQVDGTLSYEDLLEVSGMDRFDTVRIVADLVSTGIIG